MPMYDSSLPWKEKRKIIQADIDKKKKALKKQIRKAKLQNPDRVGMTPEYDKGYPERKPKEKPKENKKKQKKIARNVR